MPSLLLFNEHLGNHAPLEVINEGNDVFGYKLSAHSNHVIYFVTVRSEQYLISMQKVEKKLHLARNRHNICFVNHTNCSKRVKPNSAKKHLTSKLAQTETPLTRFFTIMQYSLNLQAFVCKFLNFVGLRTTPCREAQKLANSSTAPLFYRILGHLSSDVECVKHSRN